MAARPVRKMHRAGRLAVFIRGGAAVALLFAAMFPALGTGPALAAERPDQGAVKRGEYIFYAAGCKGCHTDTKNKVPLLAGGPAIKTPFGTFYGPNITPDPTHGIGRWSEADFIRALRLGISPTGAHYYPAFPYPSYTGIRDRDLRDLRAYVFSLPAVARPNKPHQLKFPFRFRPLLWFWKRLYFTPGPNRPDPKLAPAQRRGAYLVRALGHCAECHTPRTLTGGLDGAKDLAGTDDGPGGELVPNITPHPVTGIGDWEPADITEMLKTGNKPDGDDVWGTLMGDVVENGTSHLSLEDRRAIARYLKSLKAIDNKIDDGSGS